MLRLANAAEKLNIFFNSSPTMEHLFHTFSIMVVTESLKQNMSFCIGLHCISFIWSMSKYLLVTVAVLTDFLMQEAPKFQKREKGEKGNVLK